MGRVVPEPETRPGRIWMLAVVGVLLLSYLPAFREVNFLWDGWAWQYQAGQWVQDPALLLNNAPGYSFRPLARLFYAALYLLFGSSPSGFLATILGLHLLVALTAGVLVRRITRDPALGGWTAVLFAAWSAQTEAIVWIGAFAHVLLGLFLLLFLWLALPPEGRDSPVRRAAAVAALLLAICTREPWIVLAPVTLILIAWRDGWNGLRSSRGLILSAGVLLCAAVYLLVFRDLLTGERVLGPRDEPLMALGLDCVPRMLRSLAPLFVPRIFFADLLRSAWGGVLILTCLLGLSSLGGRPALRHALFAVCLLIAVLSPFSLYRSQMISDRYFYLAGIPAAVLVILATRGGAVLVRRVSPTSVSSSCALLLWCGVSVLGVWRETEVRFAPAWEQARQVERDLRQMLDGEPEGPDPAPTHCVFDLPVPNKAIWYCLAQTLFPECESWFLTEQRRDDLGRRITATIGAGAPRRNYRWVAGPRGGGSIRRQDADRSAAVLLEELKPRLKWGSPDRFSVSVFGVLLIRRRG